MATSKRAQEAEAAIQLEAQRISEQYGYDLAILKSFSVFVQTQLKPAKKPASKQEKPPKVVTAKKAKPLTVGQLKQAVLDKFGVSDIKGLKQNNRFQLATSGIEGINLSKKESLETLYRKLVGILPNEESEEGGGCINGINIFNYDLPWRIFGLNPKTATTEEIKTAYRNLSKVYHPDNRETGDAKVFDRLTTFYKSLTETF
jgi:DnaJ domain